MPPSFTLSPRVGRRTILRRVALATLLVATAGPAGAADLDAARAIVVDAKTTVEHFERDPTLRRELPLLRDAYAVLVFPHAVSASLIVGGMGATGVLLARDPQDGRWIGPAFFQLTRASIGLQAGATVAEVIVVVRTRRAYEALVRGRLRLGMDASFVAGTHGGVGGAAMPADIDGWGLARGASVGVALDGSALDARAPLNEAWYGRPVTLGEIFVDRTVHNAASDALANEIAAAASPAN